jgi:NADH-quinone oxidoreductase subunit C
MSDEPKPEGTPEPSAPAPPAAPDAAKAAAPPSAAAKPAAHKPPAPPAVMQTQPWESDLTAALKEEFGDAIHEFCAYVGQNFLIAKPEAVPAILEYLRDEHDFSYLVDVTAVHWPERAEQFDIVYIVYSFQRNERIRIKMRIQDGQKPRSVVSLYPTANWLEREVFDMFGVEFEDHPSLTRILMPDEWSGHPLRKDSSILNMDQHWVQQNLGIESGQ